ncbi:MAG: hypothetical protein D6782_12255 [Alphaproteobacteria bacterium]|nr:MAG: hypothetical protein D6782_12255 [Alphaproteobacteria bacterium]
MKQRGRKSSASLEVVRPVGASAANDPPAPPSELPEEQADVWRVVCSAQPDDWWGPEMAEVLAQYCRHVVAARRVADLIEQQEAGVDLDIETYDRLLRMQEREGRAMSSLATRLRLTPQSKALPSKGGPKRKTVKRPWET